MKSPVSARQSATPIIRNDAGRLQLRGFSIKGGESLTPLKPGIIFAVDLPSAQTGFRAFVDGKGALYHLNPWHLRCPDRPPIPGRAKTGHAALWHGYSSVMLAGRDIGGPHVLEITDAAGEDGLLDLMDACRATPAFTPAMIPVARYAGWVDGAYGPQPAFKLDRLIRRPPGFGPRLDGL